MEANLRLIAETAWTCPLNEWPDHISHHRRTLMGEWLFDFDCLRCHMQEVATEKLMARKESHD